MNQNEILAIKLKEWKASPLTFIEDMWNLKPQPIKPEFRTAVEILTNSLEFDKFKPHWFEPFVKGEHLTWQQWSVLLALEAAINGKASKRISTASGHGIGKFVANDSKIYKVNNNLIEETKAQDIEVGDFILGSKNKTKVIGVYPQEEQEAYNVFFDDGSCLTVGGPHLWAVRGRNSRRKNISEYEVMTTEEILKAGVKRKNGNTEARQWEIPHILIKGFKKEKNAYVIGAWYGDGTTGRSGYTEKAHKIVDYIRKLGWEVTTNGSKHTILGLITLLKDVGADYKGKNFLPKDFLSWDIDSRKSLLAGLLDTDGTIQGRNIEFGTIREGLAKDTLKLIRSLGGKGRIRIKETPIFTYKGEKKVGKRYYRVSFQTPFNPFRIDKKNYDLWKMPQDRYLSRWIDKIEKTNNMDGVCFKVDADDHLFLVDDDLIVTHNSCTTSLIVIWRLFCFMDAQIACTAPTSKQMFDVLWKEIAVWIRRMPEGWHSKFDCQTAYIRMTESPFTWFASAKTAKKDATEALAGVHGEHVMIIADEASGVPREVFNTMEGSLTEKDILVLLFSNPTRLNGYFYDTHKNHKIKKKWQTFQYSNIDSPIVRDDYNQDIIDQHGENSDEYRIRVLGEFPKEDSVDDQGYAPIFHKDDIKEIDIPTQGIGSNWIGETVMGVDPAGEGRDETIWVVRDNFKAGIVLKEKTSNKKTIANRTRALAALHGVKPHNIWLDGFGVGNDSAVEMAKENFQINSINVGDNCLKDRDKKIFLNRRAEAFWTLRKYLKNGLELYRDIIWRDECSFIQYRRNTRDKIQIMPKKEMKKAYGRSPDSFDALMLTFLNTKQGGEVLTFTKNARQQEEQQNPTIIRRTRHNLHSVI